MIDDPYHCVVGVVDVCLALTLEVFFIQWLQELMFEDVFCIYQLVPLVHLGCMFLIHLVAYAADSLGGTGIYCGGRAGH